MNKRLEIAKSATASTTDEISTSKDNYSKMAFNFQTFADKYNDFAVLQKLVACHMNANNRKYSLHTDK